MLVALVDQKPTCAILCAYFLDLKKGNNELVVKSVCLEDKNLKM